MRFRDISAVWIVFLFSITIGAIPVAANIQASFSLDESTWDATQIVLVKTTAKDGVFTVLKSWKGDLKPGDSVDVPELKPANNAVPIPDYLKPPRFVSKNEMRIGKQIPRQPVGSEMILFLKTPATGSLSFSGADTRAPRRFSSWEGSRNSTLWIDHGKAFCFRQWSNPGPNALGECGEPELSSSDVAAVTSRIQQVLQVQRNLAGILELKDRDWRAVQLGWFAMGVVYGNVYEAKIEAIEALGKSGTVAIPEMLQVMDNPPAEFYDGRQLIQLFVQAAGKNSGRMLFARLQEDVIYWKTIGPTLTQNWYGDLLDVGSPLFIKFNETDLLVRELEKENYSPAAETVTELRDFWVSQPQLYDSHWTEKKNATTVTGLDDIHFQLLGLVQDCDAFLKHAALANQR